MNNKKIIRTVDIKMLLRYLKNQIYSYIFFFLGGVHLIKAMTRNKKLLIIFNYHNFSKFNNYLIIRGSLLETDFTNNFEKQIRFFKKHFPFCYPEEFFNGKCKNGINILINFDDGYRDNYDLALPVLKKYEVKTIFFITTQSTQKNDFLLHDKIRYLIQIGKISIEYAKKQALINKGQYYYSEVEMQEIERIFRENQPSLQLMMNTSEVADIMKAGIFKIGNHTHEHLGLSNHGYNQQQDSIKKCTMILEELSATKIEHLAYPNGLYNNSTLEILKKNGIKFGYTINGGVNNQIDNQLLLKRIGINVSDPVRLIALKMFSFITIRKGRLN